MKQVVAALVFMNIAGISGVFAEKYYVSKDGLDANVGSKSRPFKTISAAAAIARPGDTAGTGRCIFSEKHALSKKGVY